MPCPVTTAFFHTLSYKADAQEKLLLDTVKSDGETFAELHNQATHELDLPTHVYQQRAAYSLQVTVSMLQRKAPQFIFPIYMPDHPDYTLRELKDFVQEVVDRQIISKFKRNGNGENDRLLSEYLQIEGAVKNYIKQIENYNERQWLLVGSNLGLVWSELHLPAELAMKSGRRLLQITES